MEEISMAFGSVAFLVIVGGAIIAIILKALRGAAGAVKSDSKAKQGLGVIALVLVLMLAVMLFALANSF